MMRAPYMRWARRTTREVLESLTRDRELIGVLTAQWGDYGLPPTKSSFAVHATIAEHYFGGGSYPVGGASTIAAAITPQIERAGGSVVSSAEVAAILVNGTKAKGVRMKDGREFRAAMVLSDAGAVNTFDLSVFRSRCKRRTVRARHGGALSGGVYLVSFGQESGFSAAASGEEHRGGHRDGSIWAI